MNNSERRKSIEQKMREFHTAFGHPCGTLIDIQSQETFELRRKLVEEEVEELLEALELVRKHSTIENLTLLADGIADSVVVIVGTAVAFGIPFDKVFEEVHKSNMAKLAPDGKPIYREDGKILKPPGWTMPNIWSIIFKKFCEDKDEKLKKQVLSSACRGITWDDPTDSESPAGM